MPRSPNSGSPNQAVQIRRSRGAIETGQQDAGEVLSDGDFFAEVDVLDGVEEADAFFEGSLEGFASRDEAHAACAFVDDGGDDGVLEIASAFGFATTIN